MDRPLRVTARILDLVKQQGFIPDPTPATDAYVSTAARRLVALLNDWDDRRADELFADNVQLDEAYIRRQSAATRYKPIALQRVGVKNESAGTAHCTDANGEALEISFMLAPILPPRIQEYDVEIVGRSDA